MNPPYDERMKVSDVIRFYEEIGNHLKHKCSGSKAWVFSSNIEAMKYIGLKPSKKFVLYNGPLNVDSMVLIFIVGKEEIT